MKKADLATNVRLSAQRALLGAVPGNLRAVTLDIKGERVEVRFYFDGAIQERDAELISEVESEMMADFEPEIHVSTTLVRLDYPQPIADQGLFVFQRCERT